jgi:hypothetical protein
VAETQPDSSRVDVRTEPPTSVPTPKGDPFIASSALSPPDEPPLERLRLCGLVV